MLACAAYSSRIEHSDVMKLTCGNTHHRAVDDPSAMGDAPPFSQLVIRSISAESPGLIPVMERSEYSKVV